MYLQDEAQYAVSNDMESLTSLEPIFSSLQAIIRVVREMNKNVLLTKFHVTTSSFSLAVPVAGQWLGGGTVQGRPPSLCHHRMLRKTST